MAYKDPEVKRQKERERYLRKKEQYAAWYQANKTKIRARVRAHREANPEHIRTRDNGMTFLPGQTIAGMRAAQGNCCANEACRAPLGEGCKTHVDHDHRTSFVRGLLCQRCNCAIGLSSESQVVLQGLVDYLYRHSFTAAYYDAC